MSTYLSRIVYRVEIKGLGLVQGRGYGEISLRPCFFASVYRL
ncbi:MAG: hypothetical protein V7K68_04735 [Nostoc sp.]